MKLTIRLPLPDPALNPNRSKGRHWASLSAKRSEARQMGFYCTAMATAAFYKQNGLRLIGLSDGDWPIEITFIMPDKRKHDRDNLLAASKPMLDGIAQALGIDDNQFEPIILRRGYEKGKGSMLVEITTK